MATGQQWLFAPAKPLVERLGKKFFRKIPTRPGVYFMRDATGAVIYVGKAKNLRQRLRSYRLANPERVPRRHLRMMREVTRIDFDLCRSESAALNRCFIGAIARTDAASRLLPEELEAMIRAGGFDKFGQTRTRQFWEAQYRIAPLVVTNAIRAGCCRRRRWKSFPRCHCGSRRVASGSKAKTNCSATRSVGIR